MTFAKLHDQVRTDKSIPDSAKALYAAISRRCINSDVCQVTQAEIADEIGRSRRQVIRLLSILVAREYIYVRHLGAGRGRQASMYYIGKSAKKMSHSEVLNVTPMSHCEISQSDTDVTLGETKKRGNVVNLNRLAAIRQKSPLNNPPKKSLKNSSISGGESRGGETSPLDKIAAAKLRKFLGKEPDSGFRDYDSDYLVDSIELVTWKIAKSSKPVANRAGYLLEALKSNWLGDPPNDFKTTRQQISEAKKREIEREKNRIHQEKTAAFNQQVHQVIAEFSKSEWNSLQLVAGEYMREKSIYLPQQPGHQAPVINIFLRGKIAELLASNGDLDRKIKGLGKLGRLLRERVNVVEAVPG